MRSGTRTMLTAILPVLTIIFCTAGAAATAGGQPERPVGGASIEVAASEPNASRDAVDGFGDDAHGEEHGSGFGDGDPAAPGRTIADVHYGDEALPEPVRTTRAALLAAARSGDVEALRAVFETHGTPVVAFGDVADAVAHLKRQSGDSEGREILAILTELLETGWILAQPGSSQETYVWPYFAEVSLDALPPDKEVELYRILTAIDVEEMRRLGAYVFYRIGIRPDGTIRFIIAGD